MNNNYLEILSLKQTPQKPNQRLSKSLVYEELQKAAFYSCQWRRKQEEYNASYYSEQEGLAFSKVHKINELTRQHEDLYLLIFEKFIEHFVDSPKITKQEMRKNGRSLLINYIGDPMDESLFDNYFEKALDVLIAKLEKEEEDKSIPTTPQSKSKSPHQSPSSCESVDHDITLATGEIPRHTSESLKSISAKKMAQQYPSIRKISFFDEQSPAKKEDKKTTQSNKDSERTKPTSEENEPSKKRHKCSHKKTSNHPSTISI